MVRGDFESLLIIGAERCRNVDSSFDLVSGSFLHTSNILEFTLVLRIVTVMMNRASSLTTSKAQVHLPANEDTRGRRQSDVDDM